MLESNLARLLSQPGFNITDEENRCLYDKLKKTIKFKKTSTDEVSEFLVSHYQAKKIPNDSPIIKHYKRTFYENIKDTSSFSPLSEESVKFKGYRIDNDTAIFFENNYGYFVIDGIDSVRIDTLFKDILLFRGIQEKELIQLRSIAINYILYISQEEII
ncbi:hypothetical protein [Jeotgalibaca caeni]|uniref:hypothetical protein n=1 Tax=Jeotgalibaca caeni TaxID=3028623 RepID=UPI00237E625D|nr:hypothetical protein [Jeotgalibaca caeni]MDE1548518.1 hypothetical protein [Jeotgalibaca caeni]